MEQKNKHKSTNGHAVKILDDDVELCKEDCETRSCLTLPTSPGCQTSGCIHGLQYCAGLISTCIETNTLLLYRVLYFLLTVLYLAYLSWALYADAVRARPLLVFSGIILVGLVWYNVGGAICRLVTKAGDAAAGCCGKTGVSWTKRVAVFLTLVSIILFMVFFIKPRPRQLVSLVGIAVFLLLLFVFSKHPSKVNVRTLGWGLVLQLVLGVLLLRTTWGSEAVGAAGTQVQKFISYSDNGAIFVFGENYQQHKFAFKILPVVIFFSGAVSVLYHVGLMQFMIKKVSWLMRVTMATSASESVCAAGNIFVGMTEAPILVKPFIADMTVSELHAMMTAGFATIAGSVLAIYITIGVSAKHLMSACVMNAPMALTTAKLFYPETQESKTLGKDIEMGKSTSRNLVDAAATGATTAVKLVANIAANLIAFIGLLTFCNAAFSWIGSMVDHPELSVQMMLSYLYLPVVVMMGVDWADAGHVAELLGMKTFINEFIAYEQLTKYTHNRQMCLSPSISVRSEVISTYALCGFANLSSLGIQVGSLRALAPYRTDDVTKVAMRSLVAGTVTCFITACVAGLLTNEDDFLPLNCLNETLRNTSSLAPVIYNVVQPVGLGYNVTTA